jgi:hypothetical protein
MARHPLWVLEIGHDIVGVAILLLAAATFAAMAWAGSRAH